ncbi:MAG: 50S ribosomal protein L29 [Prevotellaceae bacterium]|jgi:large subunit ribosomal protein L29|nr:50S ribosomal protein L29 [Prevotellaceae bacterium]
MKTREIKELSTTEIEEQLDNNRVLLNRLTLNHSISPLDNPMQIKAMRKTIAKMKTELRQREINQQ